VTPYFFLPFPSDFHFLFDPLSSKGKLLKFYALYLASLVKLLLPDKFTDSGKSQTMSNSPMPKAEQKRNWVLNPTAFRNLLGWLDEGKDSEGQGYLDIRQRLVNFFDRKNCLNPDELTDETLNRVARRLEEQGTIEGETPAKYCYIMARFVFMESLRSATNRSVPIDDVLATPKAKDLLALEPDDEVEIKENRLSCLENCTDKLEPENRQMILRYYVGEERIKIQNRRALAESLGISVNALSIRACRLRDKLEACVGKCVGTE
jgi:DNA-directed RNA polymerase specialized sigma24 family protein